MTKFEFILIPIGILIGFAINVLLTSWASLFRSWQSVSGSGFYISLSLWMLTSVLGHFSGYWEYRDHALDFPQQMLLISPTLLFMLAISVMAPRKQDLVKDYRAYYFGYSRIFFGLASAAMLLTTIPDLTFGVMSVSTLWMTLLGATPAIVLAITTRPVIHIAGHVYLWTFQVFFAFGLWRQLNW